MWTGSDAAGTDNLLLKALPRKDRQRLLDICTPVELHLSEVICERDAPTRFAYFPVDGFLSLVAQIDNHSGLEVGMIGCEGMLGIQLLAGIATEPLRALVQGGGGAWRVPARAFGVEVRRSAPLQDHLRRYLCVLMAQRAASAACLRFHLIGPRLARWLLMSQDRAQTDHFHMTHEFLAYMLGVRRVGITKAAGILQKAGAIEYHRGEVRILSRAELERNACSCYATERALYTAGMR